jgi:hypothetical protein
MLHMMHSIERKAKRAGAFFQGAAMGSGTLFLLVMVFSLFIMFYPSSISDYVYEHDRVGDFLLNLLYSSGAICMISFAMLCICVAISVVCSLKR